MAIFWDDIEILRVLDECERGERSGIFNGFELMQAIATQREVAITEQDYRTFLRELSVESNEGLLTWDLTQLPSQVRQLHPNEPQHYLQNLQNMTLTIAGRDRARNQMVELPWPVPGEDDGRSIPGLLIKDIAVSIQQAVGGQDDFRRELEFLAESGISSENFPETVSSEDGVARQTMEQLHRGASAQRRELRQFIAGWLEGALYAAPSESEHKKLVDALARQGWFVKDGRLVVGERVRGANRAGPDIARDARIAALHPAIREVSQRPFEAGEPAAAVLEAFKAVNNRVKDRSSSDADGQQLMARVFRPGDPVLYIADTASETGQNIQAGYHHMFMGAMLGIRNPHAHEHFPGLDENEALEQLGFASLLMRRLDDATWTGDG